MSTLLRSTLFVALICGAQNATAASGDWTQMGFDAQGRRENTHETVLTRKTVAGLHPVWSAAIAPTAPTAVANGVAYTVGEDQNLYAFDAATGTKLWQVPVGGTVRTSPAVADGMIYVGTMSGRLCAFDAESGTQRWSMIAGNRSIESSPAVRGGTIYFGNDDGHVYAVNAKNGVVRWTAANPNHTVEGSPAVGGGMVYFASTDGTFDARDVKTGALRWQSFTRGNYSGGAAYDRGTVYVSTRNDVYAFDAATGTQHWTASVGTLENSIALANGRVHVATEDALLWSLDAATGGLGKVDYVAKIMMATPAVANGVVYVGSMNDTISAYDTKTNALLWQAATASSVAASPTVSNGRLYVADGVTLTAYGLE